MKSEDVEVIQCDRCNEGFGLYCHNNGWRCPSCIWKERKHLIELSKRIFDSAAYSSDINELANYIHEIERQEG